MPTRDRPNLLYIHSDQHNPCVMGCAGDSLAYTPNLDRLAASGVLMGSCYCPSPICVPSRMSMLTGRHPYRNQVLIYYHGEEPQLFNLRDDPDELVDRAQDPACRTAREELTAMVLAGWHPDVIAAQMAAMRADAQILRKWAQRTQPADQYRWDLRPTMNYLDEV